MRLSAMTVDGYLKSNQVLVFAEKGNWPEYPEKKPLEKEQRTNKFDLAHVTFDPGVKDECSLQTRLTPLDFSHIFSAMESKALKVKIPRSSST